MIEIKEKQIVIDGKPVLVMCGEVHYYRLERKDWQSRIDQLKLSGCNAVATYIPWLCHQPEKDVIDLTGETKPQLDIVGFLDLCQENDLYIFVRPGPFVMAEMKNEGIPHWVYTEHPEAIPVGWDGNEAGTKTLDYLHPGFLKAVRQWYSIILPPIEKRLHTNGGKIIAIQLDNEVGMLSWVSNTPDMTDLVLNDFAAWTEKQYGSALGSRYPHMFMLEENERNQLLRSPSEEIAPLLLKDLGYYMRSRFARYISTLREYCEEEGIKDIPFVVNIHGTSSGRGFTFPIGISQLYESYTQDDGYLSGSDIYFGDFNMDMFQDLYLINGFMDAVHLPDQPLTSVEFNCGDGNFGSTFGGRKDPSSTDLKMRMCIAQGNRLINYYLMTGGYNYRMDQTLNDGNDRIAFTGERHGFAAPISPEGELNFTFPRMTESIHRVMAVSDKLAAMNEEKDKVAFAFIPDYYMTEYSYPKSEKMKEIIQNIEQNRGGSSWEVVARAMLLQGLRFGSIDIQHQKIDLVAIKTIVVPSARYMHKQIQEKLVAYMNEGGNVLLYGDLPQYDLEGSPCTILAEAAGVSYKNSYRDSGEYFLSLESSNLSKRYPEVRTHIAHTVTAEEKVTPLLNTYDTKEVCGFDSPVGKGKLLGIFTHYSCDLTFFNELFMRLDVTPSLYHDYPHHGIFMTSVANVDEERFVHVLNLDGLDKNFTIFQDGKKLFGSHKVTLSSRRGLMLPVNVELEKAVISYATAEIKHKEKDLVTFALHAEEQVAVIQTANEIHCEPSNVSVRKNGSTYTITMNMYDCRGEDVTVFFR
ncbi:glycosyl hydrolase [Jeotgalibacillus sp. S-D1]|uniref:alpha-amylase family protein n=1 Tax=Jeotgalibacillus sp. S-D1 TaxID=2552189 RepID=UPI00105A39EB|nr:alpha-amylase family protein [Jeotgalibacillus sp. S-D1]TDL33116.1 glycosyl hydrolase [Jeotgalibacillus sp. S-D1]